ncbi:MULTISPECIES: ABC transporter permease [unclassified Nocardioides]|uniref:ABC transporter permease n=1 Tax=unclassified Nocardioides TaxID=2615069 RepID=UPI000AB6D64C|nr:MULTISPECIES: ABC transporter permease [unclassified Nocardioides]
MRAPELARADRAHSRPEHSLDENSQPRSGRSLRAQVISLAERNALLLLLAVIAIYFATWPATAIPFTSSANISNLLGAQTVVGLMAIAAIFPLVVGEFDLSIGNLVAFLSIVNAAAMARFDLSVGVAVTVTLAVAVAIGLCTGLAVSRLGVPSLVITLATGTLMSGIVLWYTDGLSITTGISPDLIELGSGTWWGVPCSAYLLFAVVLVAWQVLERTPAGRYLRFIGSNRESARLVGVRVERYVTATFVTSAVLCALAAIALTARNGAANTGDGPGLLFPAIAAAFLGATTVRPGQFNVLGTIIGVFFVALSVSGLNLAGVLPWVQPVFYGASLALAVVLSTVLMRRRSVGKK